MCLTGDKITNSKIVKLITCRLQPRAQINYWSQLFSSLFCVQCSCIYPVKMNQIKIKIRDSKWRIWLSDKLKSGQRSYTLKRFQYTPTLRVQTTIKKWKISAIEAIKIIKDFTDLFNYNVLVLICRRPSMYFTGHRTNKTITKQPQKWIKPWKSQIFCHDDVYD